MGNAMKRAKKTLTNLPKTDLDHMLEYLRHLPGAIEGKLVHVRRFDVVVARDLNEHKMTTITIQLETVP